MKYLSVLLMSVLCIYVYAAEIYGTVTHVSDGDTFTIKVDEDKFRVRMQHIDAPESDQVRGKESKDTLAELIKGKQVYVEFHTIDTYGRIVGIVHTKKVFGKYKDNINEQMVRCGYAHWYKAYSKDELYKKAQDKAQEERLGIWQDQLVIYPWEWRAQKRKNK